MNRARCTYRRIGLALTILGWPVMAGAGTIYTADFNAGPEGWDASGLTWQASGGVGDTGYLQGTRQGYLPTYFPHDAGARAAAAGNLPATYGDQIRISYYVNVFEGATQAGTHALIDSTYAGLGTGGYWQRTTLLQPQSINGWTLIRFDIDASWTDSEAAANGWLKRGALSFADTLADVQWHYFYYGSGVFEGRNVTGIDSVEIASIPEPAGVSVLAFAGLLLVRRR